MNVVLTKNGQPYSRRTALVDSSIEIPLTMGLFAVVDRVSCERMFNVELPCGEVIPMNLLDVSWCAKQDKSTFYARAQFRAKRIYMHRLLLGAAGGELVDHRDLDGLNNRIDNLRIATTAQNLRNRPKQRGVASRFKGVWRRLLRDGSTEWRAIIQARVNGKKISTHLGVFATEVDAALAYDSAATERHGEFASLNFPNGFTPDGVQG